MLDQDVLDYYARWLAYRRWYLRIPGVQACVVEQGRERLSAAYGLADESTGGRLTDRHLFRIASHSKTFTAVLVLRLASRGLLRLDDRVSDHLPELAGSGLAPVTLRELLGHGGGVIRDSVDGDFWQLFRPYPDRAELIRICAEPTAAVQSRNERFKYSNIGYGVLGLVIEQVAGASFAETMTAEILAPLGLADTGPELPTDRAGELAAGHSALSYAAGRTVIEHVDTRALAAATGCYATARDLASFFSALLPDDDRLLDADAQRQLRHREWPVKGTESAYGLGVFLNQLGDHELFGHGGGYPGHITRTFSCPDRRLVVSVLTNAIDAPAEPLAGCLFRLADLAAGADHAPAPDGARFTGRFASLWGVQDVALLAGRLFAFDPTAPNPAEDPVALEVVDEHTLLMVSGSGGGSIGEPMRYEFAADGSIATVRGGSGMTLRPIALPD